MKQKYRYGKNENCIKRKINYIALISSNMRHTSLTGYILINITSVRKPFYNFFNP
jgi:hypothetical protein